MDILIWILMIIGGAVGILSTVYLVLAMPIIFLWKVYRKVKYHIALCDQSETIKYSYSAKEESLRGLSSFLVETGSFLFACIKRVFLQNNKQKKKECDKYGNSAQFT